MLYVTVKQFSHDGTFGFPAFLSRTGSRTSTKQGIICLAQGHNTMPLVSLELATL